MSYSTPSMVRQALVATSDGSQPSPASHTAADFTDDQLTDAIAEADALIDGYLGTFYAVPVALDINSAVPHPIDYWSRNLAAYSATLTYRGSLDFADTDPVARRYSATMQALTAVSNGKLKLQIPDNTTGNAGSGVGQAVNPYVGDLFTPDDFDLLPAISPQLNTNRGWQFWLDPS